ncbi:MAG TPA: glutamate ABC transporter substrate-binding protein [Micromonosporaceae bacterium]
MRIRTIAATLGVAALILSGCGQEGGPASNDGGNKGAAPDKCQTSGTSFTPATDVNISGSPTFDRIKQAGKVVIGVKFDQPNLGYKDAEGTRCGFDIEIAQMVASKLGVDPSKIEYKEIPSEGRETALQGGEVDYYVGTYSITDKRKQLISYAGPYFITGQDLLVRKDDSSITGPESLKGKKVCSATGSTSIQRIRDEGYTEDNNIVEFQTYSECVTQLLDKKVDALTTDGAILQGYAAQAPDQLKVVGKVFSEEKYGIGLPKDDKALRDAVSDILEAAAKDGTWQKIYDGTLGRSGATAQPPALERY